MGIYNHKALKEACEKKGISVRRLCINAGVSYNHVSQLKRNTPKALEVMEKLAKELKK